MAIASVVRFSGDVTPPPRSKEDTNFVPKILKPEKLLLLLLPREFGGIHIHGFDPEMRVKEN